MKVFGRQRNILEFTLSSILRRKWRIAALLAVYSLVIFAIASAFFLTAAIKREAGLLLQDAPEIVVQRLMAGRHDLIPLRYAERISAIRGVQGVRGRLWGYYFDTIYGANYTVIVPEGTPPAGGTVTVGSGLTRSSYAFVDNILPLRAADGSLRGYRVTRALPESADLVAADSVLMSEKEFRSLFSVPAGYATDLTVRVRNTRELPVIAAKIYEMFPDTRPIVRDEILRTYDSVFSWRGGVMLVLLSGGVLAFVIFAWDKATGLSAEERREIGILKASGWDTSDVLAMKFWEGMTVSLTAFLIGVLGAYLHVFFTSAALFAPALKGWAVLYPDLRLTPVLEAGQLANLLFVTVVPYTVATIVPSWKASIVDPDVVMRG